jgi:hypothetical protein
MQTKTAAQAATGRTPAEIDELLARCGAALCLASIIAAMVWLSM